MTKYSNMKLSYSKQEEGKGVRAGNNLGANAAPPQALLSLTEYKPYCP